jgi:hypothetical protein
MATLTAAQLAIFRAQSGDTNSTDVSDLQVQACYDAAVSDDALTMVYILRQRLGKAVDEITFTGGDGGTRQGNQKYEQIERLLKYWEQVAGVSGGALIIGRIDLDIDADDSNESQWDGST